MSRSPDPHRASVLLLTPTPWDERIWGRFATLLADRTRLSLGTWPRGHGSFELRPAVDEIVARTGRPDVTVAHQFDAAAAVHLARQGHTGALVLIDPSPGQPLPEVPIPDLDEQIGHILDHPAEGLEEALGRRDAAALAQAMTRQVESFLSPSDLALVATVLEDNADALFDAVLGQDHGTWWPDELPALDVPVLAVASLARARDHDLHLRLVEALVARCRQGTLRTVEADSGLPWLERTDELAEAVLGFVAGATGPACG